MQNHWMNKHLNRSYSDLTFYENLSPINLVWESLYEADIPEIRLNYREMQANWAIYTTSLEMERMESYGRSCSQIC